MTEPVPEQPSANALDRLILAGGKKFLAARQARPRDDQAVEDAREELDLLRAMRDAGV